MKYATAGAFRTALEHRLRAIAQQTGMPIVRLRKLVVFDRLMARLLVAAPRRWLLKGGLALDLRFGIKARTTKDMDLARQDNEDAAMADLLAAQSVDLGDYFTFVIERAAKLDIAFEGAAVRYRAAAELAGRPFEIVIIDVGFSDPLVADPEMLRGPDILDFAGIAPIEVPAIPLEQHIAEKVHAYSRMYPGDRQSSRVKDLIDLVVLRSAARFEAGRLRRALRMTFERRGTDVIPSNLALPPAAWGPAYRRLAGELGLDPDVLTGHQLAAAFLDPVLSGTAPDHARWDPLQGNW